ASIEGAHGVLLSVAGGSDLGLFEINEAARMVAEAAHPEANIIFGAVIDDTLGDEVRVTVIAAGFDGGQPLPRKATAGGRALVGNPMSTTDKPRPTQPAQTPETVDLAAVERKAEVGRPLSPTSRTIAFDDPAEAAADLDVPDFLK
ncbi:MAG: hypothetical protein WBB77_12270, partial [Candidatus Nanopelagicales bacterium]